jgi:hypothetical protein
MNLEPKSTQITQQEISQLWQVVHRFEQVLDNLEIKITLLNYEESIDKNLALVMELNTLCSQLMKIQTRILKRELILWASLAPIFILVFIAGGVFTLWLITKGL